MSYEIVKSISFKDNKVSFTSTCNNVVPKDYSKWEVTSLTKILKEKGKEEVIKEILFNFWNGNFQGQSTVYGKFIKTFKSDFTWENTGTKEELGTKKFDQFDVLYSNDQLKEELFKQFQEYKTKTSNKRLFFVKLGDSYIYKLTSRRAFTTYWEKSAKKFTLAQVENIKSRFTNYSLEILEV